MTQETWRTLEECLRATLFSAAGQAVGLMIAALMMKSRRSIGKLYLFTLCKTLFVLLVTEMEPIFWSVEMDPYFDTLSTSLVAVATYAMFVYTFQGEVLKILVGINLSEIGISILFLPITIIINYLEGRSDLYVFFGELQWLDLLIVPLTFLFMAVVYLCFGKILRKYREIQLKFKPFLWILIAVFFGSSQVMFLTGVQENQFFLITMYGLYLGFAICAVITLYFAYWRYQSRIHTENEFLNAQMNLIGTHYSAVQTQMDKITQVQKTIDEQMKRLQNAENSNQKERTAEYLGNLQKEYRELCAGVYCKDWMVDGILYCQEEAAKKLGIHVEYQLGSYHRGKVSEQDMAQLVYLLLDEGIRRQAGRMSLRAGLVKGRVILEVQLTDVQRKVRFSRKRYGEIIEKYDGSIVTEKTETGINMVVTLRG